MGPTASGKTDIAAALSDRFAMDLISVDAAQVYRGMNIGTAKPDPEFLIRYPHQLIDIRNPDQSYSAAEFVEEATRAIERSRARNQIPLLVGGTMFYFNALEHGLSSLPAANPALRERLEREINTVGVRAMHERLNEVDPELAAQIDRHDRQRIQRALEIFSETGKPPSTIAPGRTTLQGPLIKIALFDTSRERLHHRIGKRFETMIDAGLVDEVRNIIAAFPGNRDRPSMRIVGYRQVIEFLNGDSSQSEMFDRGVAATRQLAKRQLTWMRQQAGLTWFETGCENTLDSITLYLQSHPALRSLTPFI